MSYIRFNYGHLTCLDCGGEGSYISHGGYPQRCIHCFGSGEVAAHRCLDSLRRAEKRAYQEYARWSADAADARTEAPDMVPELDRKARDAGKWCGELRRAVAYAAKWAPRMGG